jgi:bacterioferritin-associated ferredoxin
MNVLCPTAPNNSATCSGCSGRLVCPCLGVTEEELLSALEREEVQTVKDIRRETGAGDGCTACHKLLRGYLERRAAQSPPSSSAEPICSVR